MNPDGTLNTLLTQGNTLAAAWYGSLSGNATVLPSVIAATGGNPSQVAAAQQAAGTQYVNLQPLIWIGLIVLAVIVVVALVR